MMETNSEISIKGTPYDYEVSLRPLLEQLSNRVLEMRTAGKLTPEVLGKIRQYFRIKSIYPLECN